MMKAFLPDGADGQGRWNQEHMDSAFNKACRESMYEYLAKNQNATVKDYAKTIKRVSSLLKGAWETLWALEYQLGPQVVTGEYMKKLLEDQFLGPGMWEGVHTRIYDWATRLGTTAEMQEQVQYLGLLE
jgi:hypothetical protein